MLMFHRTLVMVPLQALHPSGFFVTSFAPTFAPKQILPFQSLFASKKYENDEETAYSPDFIANEILENDVDPACLIDDEDCLAISSHSSSASSLRDSSLSQSLQRRSESLLKEKHLRNWKRGRCPTTKVSISRSDAVRRVCMDQYPIVACGSASGSIYLVDLEKQSVLACQEAHIPMQSLETGRSELKKQAMEKLYGKLDGGGVISVAIRESVVASSGREGGIKLWRIESTSTHKPQNEDIQLVSLGSLKALQNTIVTSIKFDSNGLLWVSCYDGTVRSYDVSDWQYNHNDQDKSDSLQKKVFPSTKPVHRTDFTAAVLDMHLCEDLNIGVCATADGSAALFSLEDGQFFVGIMLFEVAARSVSIVKHHDECDRNVDMDGRSTSAPGYSVLCGSMDGSIHRISLNIGPSGKVDMNDPFEVTDETETAIRPRHVGPVMCLTSSGSGMFVSGGQDGALRVWVMEVGVDHTYADGKSEQSTQRQSMVKCKCVYALTGYKLWLGSACISQTGDRLVSDGGENNIIVRDFSMEGGNDDITSR
ncbi:hypothetical protein HJC23_011500 [Cyclotella cryptica]|uniref:Uncharacterized protein n=1 Tax=Cyclotella cryptica TaxID=29204 RepID=A0ABD3PV17_9STRA|eukprot:CCRYP_011297-RA/>CCRYP_011297-RA protein AED:0.00 eAED:0.00 QI:24/-1/1/1/-1/1/1/175/536